MILISEYFSDDVKRKTQVVKNPNLRWEMYKVIVWIDGVEQTQHEKSFNSVDVAEWYAEEWTQK